MIFQRGGEVSQCHGESGFGMYAFVYPNPKMKDYYTRNGEQLLTIVPNKDSVFVDFTKKEIRSNLIVFMKSEVEKMSLSMSGYYVKPKINNKNYQRFGRMIEDFVNLNFPKCDGWIVNHEGSGIPSGKQVVIRNLESVKISN